MVALNTAYAPSETQTQPKNRVGNFFGRSGDRVGQNRPATRNRIGEKRLTLTIIASGRPVWPSRDPIGELGSKVLRGEFQNTSSELGLYLFVLNSPNNRIDLLGLSIWDWFFDDDDADELEEFYDGLEEIRDGAREAAEDGVTGNCWGVSSVHATICNAVSNFMASEKTQDDINTFAAEFCLCTSFADIQGCEEEVKEQLADIDWDLVDEAIEILNENGDD